ncbi:MAG: DNA double-strand break repair nuclease NurA [Chloroflexi bacterium]|nr:DNA double-strand break repair nuclease NurA [Chloroflexota bacterium]
MTLEFHKLTEQVDRMGQYFAEQAEETEDKVEIAWQILNAHADEAFLPYILERVQDAVDKDAGYRGARPIDEPITQAYPPALIPDSATIVATDGSQIHPNRHQAAQYYLLNIGTIVVDHGSGEPPLVSSEPYLFYERGYLLSPDFSEIKATVVNARRTVAEMAALAEHTWHHRGDARPLIAMLDGGLLFIATSEVPDRNQLLGIYFSAMTRLEEVGAGLAGYVDRPRSKFVARMLHLLDMDAEYVSRNSLGAEGRLGALQDAPIFAQLLHPGERTALFVQMSPQNKEFRRRGGEAQEITFFYMNVAARDEKPNIVRVEVPMWVANERDLIAEMQALIYLQCQQLASSRFPYVLTRSHELAIVKREESRQLDTMIQVAMTRHGIPGRASDKEMGKTLTNAVRRQGMNGRPHG